MAMTVTSLICMKLGSIPLFVACVLVVFAQDFLLDYLLIQHFNGSPWWFAWIAVDVIVIGLVIACYVLTPARLSARTKNAAAAAIVQVLAVGMPLSFVAWLAYSAVLCAKIALVFKKDIAQTLDEEDLYGPNFLRTAIGLTSVVFISLVNCHHNRNESARVRADIGRLASTVTLDILDSVDFLDVLFIKETHITVPYRLEDLIVAISCINILRPFLSLLLLGLSSSGRRKLTADIKIASILIAIILVDAPFLVVRMYLWHNMNHDISVFLIKNFIMIFLSFTELVDECSSARGRSESDSPDGIREPAEADAEHVALKQLDDTGDGGRQERGPVAEGGDRVEGEVSPSSSPEAMRL